MGPPHVCIPQCAIRCDIVEIEKLRPTPRLSVTERSGLRTPTTGIGTGTGIIWDVASEAVTAKTGGGKIVGRLDIREGELGCGRPATHER